MTFILKLKHWQLFCLLVMFPGLANALSFSISMPGHVRTYDKINFFLVCYTVFVFLAWLRSIVFCIDLNFKPAGRRMGYYFFLVSISLVASIFLFISLFYAKIEAQLVEPGPGKYLLPALYFLCIICLFYSNIFVSRKIQRSADRNEVFLINRLLVFILLLGYPIGIWFIQPKMNALIKNGDNSKSID